MGNSLFCSRPQVSKVQQVASENKEEDNAEAIKVWPTSQDPCTYLKAPASFGDPTIYMIDNGRLPLVPHFQEYGVLKTNSAVPEIFANMNNFVDNIQTRGWYPQAPLSPQHFEWLSNPKVLEALLQRFVTALQRRRVVHPVFTKTRTTHRLKIDYNAQKTGLNIQYCVADPMGWWIYDCEVPRDALLSGSLWHDVEYHERHNTPEARRE